jgi:hypothetical protein
MIRPILTEIGIFLIPFAVYAIYLLASRSRVFHHTSWPLPVVGWLALGAMSLTILSLVLLANFSGAPPTSTYVPAHIENGRLIPGREE